jgi:hypothetical protein
MWELLAMVAGSRPVGECLLVSARTGQEEVLGPLAVLLTSGA